MPRSSSSACTCSKSCFALAAAGAPLPHQAFIELAPRHPGLSESIVADVLATMRGRGFAALHYFEQMAPEVKEEAVVMRTTG